MYESMLCKILFRSGALFLAQVYSAELFEVFYKASVYRHKITFFRLVMSVIFGHGAAKLYVNLAQLLLRNGIGRTEKKILGV